MAFLEKSYNMIKSLKYFGLTMSFALTSLGFQNIFFARVEHLKKKYWKDKDFEVARTRKWGERDLGKKLLSQAIQQIYIKYFPN